MPALAGEIFGLARSNRSEGLAVGEDNEAVLREMLGISDAQIAELYTRKGSDQGAGRDGAGGRRVLN